MVELLRWQSLGVDSQAEVLAEFKTQAVSGVLPGGGKWVEVYLLDTFNDGGFLCCCHSATVADRDLKHCFLS